MISDRNGILVMHSAGHGVGRTNVLRSRGSTLAAIRCDNRRIGDDLLPAEVVIWAAGVAASPLGAALGAKVDRQGRVFVEPDLTIPQHWASKVRPEELSAFTFKRERMILKVTVNFNR